ncbi:MAG: DUF433 domain-containing protein [Chloroflexi bacterium]|nr:DUF433 domain-containing protein [Chloroflexota bacterium]MBU1751832.1 DUF433 domain-containing protein [Chloroflexota bacterium]MBU1877389.1 DUF433 domain-containing protein [Chloroflexota bacterium]
MRQGLIISDPTVMMGKPVISGTRITVELVLEKLAAGETIEQILDAHLRLTREAIPAVQALVKTESILHQLSELLTSGWYSLQIMKVLEQAVKSHQITNARYFFVWTYQTSERESILTLAKLAIPDKDSITIHCLLNHALQSRRAFPFATPAEIKQAVARDKKQLEGFAPLIETIKGERDHVLAHFDRKLVNDPLKAFSHRPVDMTEVERCLQELLRIVNTYKGYCNNSELGMSVLERNLQEDIAFLIMLMQRADADTTWVE